MIYMFKNNQGFQRGVQLLIRPIENPKFAWAVAIGSDKNPDDEKQYQLSDLELVEFRDLLNKIISERKLESWTSKLDIQEADVVG